MISYNNKILQNICFRSATAIKYLGEEAATALRSRHADMQAASNLYDLPFGYIDIVGNKCKIIVPKILSIQVIPNYEALKEGSLYDWATVERIKVMGINDVQ